MEKKKTISIRQLNKWNKNLTEAIARVNVLEKQLTTEKLILKKARYFNDAALQYLQKENQIIKDTVLDLREEMWRTKHRSTQVPMIEALRILNERLSQYINEAGIQISPDQYNGICEMTIGLLIRKYSKKIPKNIIKQFDKTLKSFYPKFATIYLD